MKDEKMPGPQIFLSYSHSETEKQWVRDFAQSLEHHGFSAWLDEARVHAGDSLKDAIEDGLRSSDIFVVVVSPASINRPSLFFELGAALGMGKRVVAVVPRSLSPSLLPQPLRSRKFLLQESPEETAAALVAEFSNPASRALVKDVPLPA